MRQEVGQFRGDESALARREPADVAAQRLQQGVLINHMRQGNRHQNQQGHDGQQRVIGHGTGQQQALVGAKALEHPQRESAGMAENIGKIGRKRHEKAPFPGLQGKAHDGPPKRATLPPDASNACQPSAHVPSGL